MANQGKHKMARNTGDKTPLAQYRAKRNFDVTPEPSGTPSNKHRHAKSRTLAFVIQKHAASHLHYDFRLELDGVLKSWAIAKGPSYYPGDRRLAIEVEDHPLAYGGFEGIIPKGQYGGGTVMLWDRGTWEPTGNAAEGLRKGNLKFALHGEKLHGNWALVRMGGKFARQAKPSWLLIKEHDSAERSADDEAIIEQEPNSVLSGRDMEAIADAKDAVWNSRKPPPSRKSHPKQTASVPGIRFQTSPTPGPSRFSSQRLATIPAERLPSFISPQLASVTDSPPAGEDWVHELKLDGYRIQARMDSGNNLPVRLLTRTGLDWTQRMKPVAEAIAALPVKAAILDGEVVVLAHDGTTSFANLQAAFQEGARHPLTYFVFDLLHLDGHNLRNLPLLDRKKALSKLLAPLALDGTIRISEHIAGSGRTIFNKACKLGAEGIISKLAQRKYVSGRGNGWLKHKCYREQEFVIGGFTLPSNGIRGIGALLLGYYRNGRLVYAGRTGTGFTQKTHRMMRDRLESIPTKTSPFASLPNGTSRGVHWVKPRLVAQIAFANWTADNLVRQAAFKGLREDKPPNSVRREEEKPVSSKPEVASEPHTQRKTRANISISTAASKERETLPIRLTHPDKVLDVESGLTKDALAHYYAQIAPQMLAQIAERPLSLVRCMNGSNKPCFFQKHANDTLPEDIGSIDIVDKKTGKPEPYITLSTPRALVELAQLSVLEIHAWGSRNKSLEKPDRIVIDLDPDAAIDWKTLAAAAEEVRRRLTSVKLKSFLKATGGKGLHIVTPIKPEHEWSKVKDFAHRLVLAIEADNPSLYLTRMTKSARKGKIYLDYLRNERGATAIAPYSPRARDGATVAIPLHWSELKSRKPLVFTVSDFSQWKERLKDDPWKGLDKISQRLHIGT